MGQAFAIGIDVGTTNVKVVVVDDDGHVHAHASRTLTTDVDGPRAELDAEAVWQAVVAAVIECRQQAADEVAAVIAVGVDSQYSSIVAVDAAGMPVAPMRLWSDRRGTARSRTVGAVDGTTELFIDRHGLPPMGNGLSLGHILHLQHESPDVHAPTAAYLEPMDYVNVRLTGRIAANQATQFMSQLIDNRTLGQTAYDDDLVARAGVDPSRLPPLLGMDRPVGSLLPTVADLLGAPDTAVVYAGINDTQAGSVAAGVGVPGRAGLSVGTTAVLVDAVASKRADLDHDLLTCPGPFADQFLLMAENGIAGAAVEHVVERLIDTGGFDTLDDVLAATPAGSGGVLFLPWLRGSMAPMADAAMRGGFINVGLDTDRAAMVRATVEGVAHNLAWLLPFAEALTTHAIDEVVFVGGGARSTAVAQVLADVIDRPVVTAGDAAFAIARATGLLALHRAGALTRTELADRASTGARFEPIPDHRSVYARHQSQFEAAFSALRPIVRALRG